LHEVSVLMCFC
jgi:hypothetical protein